MDKFPAIDRDKVSVLASSQMNTSWEQFENRAPAMADIGRRLLCRSGNAEVALLASLNADGSPQLSPICAIFSGSGLYLLAASGTPKVNQLRRDPRFALHAQVGADDLEFRINGQVIEVHDERVRARVIVDIPFPDFSATDPLFEFLITAALTVQYGNVKPPIRHRYP